MDAIIKGSFWTDHRIEEAPAEIKLACLWLVTNPSRDLCGFTQVSNKRFTFEAALLPEFLEGACKGLPSSFVEVSPGVFFAVNFLRHQFGKGGKLSLGNKVVIAAARHAAKLRKPLKVAFFEAYPELSELVENEAKKLVRNEAPSIPHTEKRDGVRVRVREGERAMEEGCGEKPDLVGIVHCYPRRQDEAQALEFLTASIRKGADPETVRAGTRAIAAVIMQLPSGPLNSYVPSAATFFKNERWRDDPQTWRRNGAAKNGAQVGKLDLGGRRVGEVIRVKS